MYGRSSGLILGFHGTDATIAHSVLNGEIAHLQSSNNNYDWLGPGIYFWDNSSSRALEWALSLSQRSGSKIKQPAVIGAIIDLGLCLDLLDYKNLSLVKAAYNSMQDNFKSNRIRPPENLGNETDLLRRNLDCAVIRTLHDETKDTPFDSIRSVFWEGPPLYPNAGFREKNHIQICIRNPACIKGYFSPLDL